MARSGLNLEAAVGFATDNAARNRDTDGYLLVDKQVSYAGSIGDAGGVGLLSGFGAAEGDGRWSLGEHCSVDLKLRGLEPAFDYVVSVEVLPFEMGGHHAAVKASADDLGAACTVPLGLGWVTIVLPCRIDTSARPWRARLNFWVDNPTSPAALGIGNDARQLGFKLGSLRLDIADPAAHGPLLAAASFSQDPAVAPPARTSARPGLGTRLRRWLADESTVTRPVRWLRRMSQSLLRIESQHSATHDAMERRHGEVRAEVAALQSQSGELGRNLAELVNVIEVQCKQALERDRGIERSLAESAVERRALEEVLVEALSASNRSASAALLQTLKQEQLRLQLDFKESMEAAIKQQAISIDAASNARENATGAELSAALQARAAEAIVAQEQIVRSEVQRLALIAKTQGDEILKLLASHQGARLEPPDVVGPLSSQMDRKFVEFGEFTATALVGIVAKVVARQIDEEVPLLISLHQKLDSLVSNSRPHLFVRVQDGWLVRTQVGYFSCAPSDEMLVMYLAEYGELEPALGKLMMSLLRPGDVFVDVGANIGLHAIAAARRVDPKGKVYAIEASPPTLHHLRKSIHLSGVGSIIDVLPVAAGSKSEHGRTMHLSDTSGHSSLFGLPEEAARVQVEVATLDQLIDGRVDLVKIDVEGAELDVIQGMQKMLIQSPEIAIVAEFAPSHLARAGVGLEDWQKMVARHGFDVFSIEEPNGSCLPVARLEELMNVHSVNLIFAKPGTRIWRELSGV